MREWKETTLGQIATQRKGINYKSEDYCIDDMGHPFITIKCFSKGGGYEPTGIKFYDGFSTKFDHLATGDILFSVTDLTRAGDIVGSPLRVPDFGSIRSPLASMDCMRLDPISDRCSKTFLYHRLMLADVRRQMVAYAAGSTVLHLDTKKVPFIRVGIPSSVRTQEKIASILTSIDTAIEKTEALIAKYQQIKAGLMHDLFTRGVLPNGQLRPPREQAPELYQETAIGWIPRDWNIVRLVDLFDFPSGQVDPRMPQFSEWILVAPDHIEKETGRLMAKETAAAQGAISGKYSFQPGDIVYSKIRPYLRKAILADFTGICSADMYPLRPILGISSRYLLAVMLGNSFSRFAINASMRSGFPKINRNEMAGYKFAMPPSNEQAAAAEILSTHDELLTTTLDALLKLGTQKLGLMQDLLTGKVLVNVNEPMPEPLHA